jgi:MFS family permease
MTSAREEQTPEDPAREPRTGEPTVWGALREPLFRALWVAALASNVGTWMQNVAAAWLMTELATTATPVALVQTATYLPMFVLGLFAGALADIADKRQLLILTQAGMAVCAAALGVLTLLDLMTPGLLLSLTFAIGLGTALMLPAWQAAIPEVVPSSKVPSAVALNAASINVARATGPALAGFIIAIATSGAVFLINSVSFLGLMIVLYRWHRQHPDAAMPRERMLEAVRAGGRYVRHSPTLRAALVRSAAFTFFATSIWALLPLVAKREFQFGATGFGALMGCMGAGALIAAGVLPRLRTKLSRDAIITGSTAVFAAALGCVALVTELPVVVVALAAAGFAWLSVLTDLTTATTTLASAWVRARALAMYLLVFQGAMAVGSAGWGALADAIGHGSTLAVAAGGLALTLPLALRYRVRDSGIDITPSPRRNELKVEWDPDLEQGPVVILVEYRIDPKRASEFMHAAQELGRIRRRDGARRWGVFRDASDASRYLEFFAVESWGEYLRQRERLTVGDIEIQERVRSFHVADGLPKVGRFIDPGLGPSQVAPLQSLSAPVGFRPWRAQRDRRRFRRP